MSVEALVIALHHSRTKGATKLVLLGIANHDGDGGSWPSVATLAKYAKVDKRSVQRSLDELERMGEIRRILGQGGDHSMADYRRPNLYRFLLSCPHDCDRTTNHRTTHSETVWPDVEQLSTGVTPMSPRGVGVRGRGDVGVTQTNLLNLNSQVLNATQDAGGGKLDALTGGDPESQAVHHESSAERYQRLIHEKCTAHKSGKHDFRWGPCGWCGRAKPTLSGAEAHA
jgi:hypothetical protein